MLCAVLSSSVMFAADNERLSRRTVGERDLGEHSVDRLVNGQDTLLAPLDTSHDRLPSAQLNTVPLTSMESCSNAYAGVAPTAASSAVVSSSFFMVVPCSNEARYPACPLSRCVKACQELFFRKFLLLLGLNFEIPQKIFWPQNHSPCGSRRIAFMRCISSYNSNCSFVSNGISHAKSSFSTGSLKFIPTLLCILRTRTRGAGSLRTRYMCTLV